VTYPIIRIIKVGGSLLEIEQLPRLLTHWLEHTAHDQASETIPQEPRIDILIAGGGVFVDHVRQLDQRFCLSLDSSHWMSITAMSCTARLLASLLDVDMPCKHWDDLQVVVAGDRSRRIVFDVQQWLAETERNQPGVLLTHDWNTTSDSIAGRLARVLFANELILLKSTDSQPGNDWRVAAEQGLVDEHFPRIAAELPRVVWVNLRQFKESTTASYSSIDARTPPVVRRGLQHHP